MSSGSPTALARQISLPDTTPLILYHDPANFDQLDGMTWDGKISGRLGTGVMQGGIPDPFGAVYATQYDIRDRSGRVLGPLDTGKATTFWADDRQHYCDVERTAARDVASAGELRVVSVAGSATDVMRVGSFAPASFNGGGPYVVACSLSAQRAVVVQSGGQGLGTVQYWVVDLAARRVAWTRKPYQPVQITASQDGTYIAENPLQGPTKIYDSTGKLLGSADGWISLFSWDGALAVTSPTWTAGPVSLIRWRDGTVVWRAPAGAAYGYWGGVTEPLGSRVALGLRDPAFPQTRGFPPVDLYVVAADGKVIFERRNIFLFPTV